MCGEGPDRDRGASNPVPGYQQRHASLGALQVALPAPLAAAVKLLTATGRVAGLAGTRSAAQIDAEVAGFVHWQVAADSAGGDGKA